MARAHDGGVVEGAGLDVMEFGVARRGCVERRAAIGTEPPRQLVAAVAALGEAARPAADQAKAGRLKPHPDIEGAACGAAAIGAMAVIRRPDFAVIFVSDA